MRRWLIGGMAALTFAVGIGVGALGYWGWSSDGVEGTHRPAFSLPDLDGDRRAISEWDGQVIVLNFWATWCPPCREEIPRFVELQQRFRDRGVQFVGVAVDRRSRAADFADAHNINYPILYGMDRVLDVQSRYGNTAGTLPYTVVIDGDGFVRHIFPELVEAGELAPILAQMVGSA